VGGAAGGIAIEKVPVWPSQTVHAVLWRPAAPSDRKPVAILLMHEYADFTQHSACSDLSSRGFQVLCANGRFLNAQGSVIWDDLTLDLKAGVEYLRKQPDIKKVFLLGHSGGGALMPYYENVAENGVAACQDARRISPCSNTLANMPKVDGLILLDPIPGLAFADLTNTDPSVTAEDQFGRIDPAKIDASLDMFSVTNGYDAKKPSYSADFVKRFYAAEGSRYARLVDLARSRSEAIKAGKGWFPDDEPFIVGHANARLWTVDVDLLSHTQQPHTILTKDGQKQEIARSIRTVGTSVVGDVTKANLPYRRARQATVRSFLSTFAIRTTPDFTVTADSVVGVDWQSTNTSLLANLAGVKAPLLMASMTGHYWLVTTEMGFNAAASSDKTLVYIEGATHGFTSCKACETTPGQFGDTNKTLMDYVAKWLNGHA
jgi:pimeloyl-ACP methyl ester carboxylesterase